MSEGSLTVSRRLVEELKPEICCSESGATCRDDAFCSSNPKEWPAADDPARTRLVYPPDKKRPSIPAVPQFCGAYQSWYQQSDCRLLARDITGKIPGQGRSILVDSLKDRCSMLYDDEPGGRTLNESRSDDLKRIMAFCQDVKPQDKPASFWGFVFKGGGAAGGAALVGYIIWKVAKAIKNAGEVFWNISVGVAKFSEGTDMIAKGVRRLFTTSIPNLARVIKYGVTFGWLRGKKPPETISPPSDSAAQGTPAPQADVRLRGTPAPTAARLIEAHVSVVRAQLSGLAESEHYSREGSLFVSLDPVTREYIAFLAIKMWDEETEDAKRFYIQDDHLLTEGKLPVGFINKFARTVLTERKALLLAASAAVWKDRADYADLSIASWDGEGSGILRIILRPEVETVRAQLALDPRYASESVVYQNYLARKAIFIWENAPDDAKVRFIRSGGFPDRGQLPDIFVQSFLRREALRQFEIMRRAWIFQQIAACMPAFSGVAFNILDSRAGGLLLAWDSLPHSIQREFTNMDRSAGIVAKDEYLPASFVDFMRPVLKFGTAERGELQPADEPWIYVEGREEVYRGHAIGEIMRHMTLLNDGIERYPKILSSRAMLVVDMWLALNRRVQAKFIVGETRQREGRRISLHLIPPTFISFVFRIAGAFSTDARGPLSVGGVFPVRRNDDDPDESGGASGASGDGTPPPTTTPAGTGAEAQAVASPAVLGAGAMVNMNIGAALLVGGVGMASSLMMPPVMMIGM